MFILRRVTSDNLESFHILGNSFSLIDKDRNPGEYIKCRQIDKSDFEPDAYIFYNDGRDWFALNTSSHYEIMVAGNGDSFMVLTEK